MLMNVKIYVTGHKMFHCERNAYDCEPNVCDWTQSVSL